MSRPTLVVPVYRGGERFQRCLRSLAGNEEFFAGIVLSVNGPSDSLDLHAARAFAATSPAKVLILNTGHEVTSMDHGRFWAAELRRRGLAPRDRVLWLAHDDELHRPGLLAATAPDREWALDPTTTILGPWLLRHEAVDRLYEIPEDESLETWTCFPGHEGRAVPAMHWVRQQLTHPTYLSFSGAVFPFSSMLSIIDSRPRKKAGMRIEMSVATAPGMSLVTEAAEPLVIVYGRADSDRATIPAAHARQDDAHLLAWLARYASRTPGARAEFGRAMAAVARQRLDAVTGRAPLPAEDWVVRS